jgi:hypothetical protein
VMLPSFGWWGVVSVFRAQGPDDIVLHPLPCLEVLSGGFGGF